MRPLGDRGHLGLAAGAADYVQLPGGNFRTALKYEDRKGDTRVARGLYFYQKAHDTAKADGVPLSWTLQIIPGARHNHAQMSVAALDFVE